MEKKLLQPHSIGVLNIFSLDIINNEPLQKELMQCKLKQMNSYVNIALALSMLNMLCRGIAMPLDFLNAKIYFYHSLSVFFMTLIWKLLEMKFLKATPIIGVLHMISVTLFVNLVLRNIFPGAEFVDTETSPIKSMGSFSYVLCCTFLNLDFKQNLFFYAPAFLVSSYFQISALIKEID